jgi:hypothetical protein
MAGNHMARTIPADCTKLGDRDEPWQTRKPGAIEALDGRGSEAGRETHSARHESLCDM